MLTHSEENYLKTIHHLSEETNKSVSTNAIADKLSTKAASATDMVQKLAAKGFASYYKYKGVRLTDKGTKEALKVVRKHRLWEVFLVKKLNFKWDEVHEIAEQLEHIKSPMLIERLDEHLGFPKFDPHGDPIPNREGIMAATKQLLLSELAIGNSGIITAVKDGNTAFLQYLEKIGAFIGAELQVLDKVEFDDSLEVSINGKPAQFISKEASQNILITE
ncbi:MAG: metal-dependent transcriptional regulator [Cyclobacteriaceae bacterium]|nr:metal-dependent transcriptional regulator [Cyclobacteriaceae bacterium]